MSGAIMKLLRVEPKQDARHRLRTAAFAMIGAVMSGAERHVV
jgi:hypothetical protein